MGGGSPPQHAGEGGRERKRARTHTHTHALMLSAETHHGAQEREGGREGESARARERASERERKRASEREIQKEHASKRKHNVACADAPLARYRMQEATGGLVQCQQTPTYVSVYNKPLLQAHPSQLAQCARTLCGNRFLSLIGVTSDLVTNGI